MIGHAQWPNVVYITVILTNILLAYHILLLFADADKLFECVWPFCGVSA